MKSAKGKEVPKEELDKEREKLERMLVTLEKERKEEIISSSAYTEMKKSIDSKLQRIDKKLESMKKKEK